MPYELDNDSDYNVTMYIDIRKSFIRGHNVVIILPIPKVSAKVPGITKEKQKDIASMLSFMSNVNKQCYLTIGITDE